MFLDLRNIPENMLPRWQKPPERFSKILGMGQKKSGSAKLQGTCMISATASTGTTTPIPEHCWLTEF